MLKVVEATDKKTLKDFFNFPYKLYKGNKYNAPALISDERDEFNPEKNGAYEHSESIIFVAYKDNKAVGRIAGIINHKYNKKTQRKEVRFTRYDVIDDIEVSRALINAVEKWGFEKGMDTIIGPIGFSDFDKQGMLIEGYEEMDLYVTIYNYPYYVEHMQRLGFEKGADWIEYELKIPDKVDERLDRMCNQIMKRYNFTYLEIKDYDSVRPLFKVALGEIMNEAYAHLYGYIEMNDKQIEREAEALKQIFLPECATVIMNGDEIAGYGFMAPNITEALQKANGHIIPFGIIPFIKALKKYDKVDLYSIGVRKKYQGKGVNALIMNRCFKTLVERGVKYVYTGPELETNNQVQAQWRVVESRLNRRRRCWTKPISQSNR